MLYLKKMEVEILLLTQKVGGFHGMRFPLPLLNKYVNTGKN